MRTAPTVLFVHGAWHKPEQHYKTLTDGLTAAGFNVLAPAMPSTSGARPPTSELWDDVDVIRAAATKLVDEGRSVLVMAHSYGHVSPPLLSQLRKLTPLRSGIVMTNAITEELTRDARAKAGKTGGVTSLLYLCAFLPQIGGSVSNLWTGSNATLKMDISDDGVAFPANPVPAFYNDVDAAAAQRYADALHVQPAQSFVSETRATAWSSLPLTYVFCEQDGAIPIALQHRMLDAVRADGAPRVRTVHIDASHSPWLSRLGDVIAAVKDHCEAT